MRWLTAGICVLLAGSVLRPRTRPRPARTCCALLRFRQRPACHGSCKDLKAARQAFGAASNSKNRRIWTRLFTSLRKRPVLVPQNTDYLTAREMTRQHLARLQLEHGNSDLIEGRPVEALAEFQAALNLDPQNEFTHQRLLDAVGPARAKRKPAASGRQRRRDSSPSRPKLVMTFTTTATHGDCSPQSPPAMG